MRSPAWSEVHKVIRGPGRISLRCVAVKSMLGGASRSVSLPGVLAVFKRLGGDCDNVTDVGLLLMAPALLLATCIQAVAAGESSPQEVFRPNTTPGWNNEWFSVDLDLGTTRLVVGSEQYGSFSPGMVHVYRRAGGVWRLEQVIANPQGSGHISFGSDVALSDDEKTLFVGAPTDGSPNAGAVHVFRYSEGPGWTAAGKLIPPDGVELDHFGGTVEVSGDHLAVAAYRTNDKAFDSGSIYMFVRQADGTWIQTQKINLHDGAESDLFGNRMHLEGDLLVASSVTRDIDGFSDQGLVQTFQRDPISGQWRDLGRLTAHDGSPYDYYGSSLALSGNRLAVGVYGRGVPKADGIAFGQGSVYIYERDPGQASGWRFVKLIKCDDGKAGDWFGRSVAFEGEILIVGAPLKVNAEGIATGAAYAFLQDGGGIANNWRQVHKFNYAGTKGSAWFGDDVAVSGTDVFIGARRDSQVSYDQGSLSRFNRAFDLGVSNRNHDQWLKSHFTTEELLAPGLRHTRWGDFADPDGDSLGNDAEYFSGTHPLVFDLPEAQPKSVFSGNDLIWSLGRSTEPGRNAVAYLASGDLLRNWRRRADTIISNTGSIQTMTLPNYRSNGSSQFYRLAYEMP